MMRNWKPRRKSAPIIIFICGTRTGCRHTGIFTSGAEICRSDMMSQTLQIKKCLGCGEVLFDSTKSYHGECYRQKRRDDSRAWQEKKRFQRLGFRKCVRCHGIINKKSKQRYCSTYCRILNDWKNWNPTQYKRIMKLV